MKLNFPHNFLRTKFYRITQTNAVVDLFVLCSIAWAVSVAQAGKTTCGHFVRSDIMFRLVGLGNGL